MEHNVYTKKNLKKPTFFQKVLGKKLKENALTEVNNLLAEKPLQTIQVDDIQAIANRYGVNFKIDYDHDLANFYQAYLTSCLKDKYLSEEEIKDLKHLKYILGLTDADVDDIHQNLAGTIYKKEVEKIIQDGELDEEERYFIEKLQNDLKLPPEVADKIYQKSGQELIRLFMDSAFADAQLTPDEERELYAISKNLNAELNFDDATRADLEKYKLYWQIENGQMPELEVDLHIPRSEKCYFQSDETLWLEPVQIHDKRLHSRSSLNLQIAKGSYWREKNKETRDLSPEEWKEMDQGKLYLTNKRIFFRGANGDKIILLSRIMNFKVYSNGIYIDKENDEPPFFKLNNNPDILAMLLGKAISQLKI